MQVSSKEGRIVPTVEVNDMSRGSHNISVSDEAWNHWDTLAKELKLRSRSELMERIGKGEIKIQKKAGISDAVSATNWGSNNAPISVRLGTIYSTDNPLLRSITASIYRYSSQLNLYPRDDLNAMIKPMHSSLIDAAKIIEIINHLRPGYTPRSLPSLITWISYNILFEEANQKSPSFGEEKKDGHEINDEEIERMLWKIGFSFFRMKKLYPKEFRILQSRFIFQKKYSVIIDYLKHAHNEIYTNESILLASMSARRLFRALLHKLEDEGEADEYFDHDSRQDIDVLIAEFLPKPKKDYEFDEYCRLACKRNIKGEDHNKICRILQNASNDLLLEFWIDEFDHLMGHRIGLIRRREFHQENLKKRQKANGFMERAKPSYSKDEAKSLTNLVDNARQEVSNLNKKINLQYSLMHDLSELDEFLLEKAQEVSQNLDVLGLLHKSSET